MLGDAVKRLFKRKPGNQVRRSVGVYLSTKGKVIVLPYDTEGSATPGFSILESQEHTVVGQAVLAGLAASASAKVRPWPKDWKLQDQEDKITFKAMFKSVGATTWIGMQRKCVSLSVTGDDKGLKLLPLHRSGYGYLATKDDQYVYVDLDPAAIGCAVMAMLEDLAENG
jgi:hypothetical protein